MALAHHDARLTGADPDRPFAGESISNLAMWLQQQYSEGVPYNDAMVFEVLTRAFDAEHPNHDNDTF